MAQFFTKYFPNVVPIWSGDGGVTQAINETLYMTALTAIVAGILGIIIGILLVLTDEGGLLANHPFYFILDKLVNIFRAVPFIILLAIMTPVTRAIVGTDWADCGIGTFNRRHDPVLRAAGTKRVVNG